MSVGLLAACVQIGLFPCESDSQCALDGRAGQCLSPGFCALPDDDCDSGYRWHERGVPEAFADQCAPVPDEASSSSSGMGSSSSSSSTGSSSSDGGSSSGSTLGSDGDSSTSGGSPCGDHPCPCTRSVATGANHTCVARTDGRVVCWGADNRGQLGQGPGAGPIPEPQTVVIPGEVFIDVVQATNNGNCALGSDDAVWCWGENNNGELTTPAESSSGVSPVALPLSGIPGAVGQGTGHTCVGDSMSSGVRCLGNNSYQELGGSGEQPIDGAVPSTGPVDQLALGNDHSCARAEGQVWCWGRDNYGQLGQNMVEGPTAEPTPVSLSGEATLIVAGDNHTCVALDGGSAVQCWGRGHLGQNGDGGISNRQLPTAIDMPLPAAVVAMDAMIHTTCALLDDGSLWCWGDDNGGVLGTSVSNGEMLLVPTEVLRVGELPGAIVEIALGAGHLCGRAESGRLWCWGRNTSWQLGPDDPSDEMRWVELDVECPPQ